EVLESSAMADVIVALYDPAIPGNRLASPNKLFEAMMFAKPVIVSDGTRMAEVVREAGCGIVVPYGDRRALQTGLERLMLSPSEASAMGARGRAAYEAKYTWKAMADRLVKAYAEL
ncbi:MAG TPA: glycosyltransferase, partial [Thermoplasmata archaeon]